MDIFIKWTECIYCWNAYQIYRGYKMMINTMVNRIRIQEEDLDGVKSN